MAIFDVTITSLRDVPVVAEKMCSMDQREIWASGRWAPEAGLFSAVKQSSLCYTWSVDGEPEAVFGVAPLRNVEGGGSPWLLGSCLKNEYKREILRKSRYWMHEFRSRFRYLENYVYTENHTSVRWLRDWCGFNVEEPVPFGSDGELFHRFWWRRS